MTLAPDDPKGGHWYAHAPWDMAYEGYVFEADLTPFPDEPLATGGEP